jgi:hypothetical protein
MLIVWNDYVLSPKKEGSHLQPRPSNPWHSTATKSWPKILHTHHQTSQVLDFAYWTQGLHITHQKRTATDRPSQVQTLVHTDSSKRTIPFNVHKVFTPESPSSLFISIHRTSVVSILIKSLAVSLSWNSSAATNRLVFTRRSGKREASSLICSATGTSFT